jgi:hypothetical protein
MVRLEELEFHRLAGHLGAQGLLEVRQRGVSIDLGFALSEPVEIRAVDDGDLFHGGEDPHRSKQRKWRKGKNRFLEEPEPAIDCPGPAPIAAAIGFKLVGNQNEPNAWKESRVSTGDRA